MGALLSLMKQDKGSFLWDMLRWKRLLEFPDADHPVAQWLDGSFTKITVTVKTEAELLELHDKAKAVGIPNALIKDNGKTEFHGVPTHTALAIGPWWSDEIDKITGNLPLY